MQALSGGRSQELQRGLNNGYQWRVLLKLRLMDGLSKKIIALVGKWVCVLRGGRAGSTERMMGSDSGLSRGSGCPEKCEARAMRWQERAGCQSKKVALIHRKAKESACQACSANRGRKREYGGIGVDVVELGEADVPLAWLQVQITQSNETVCQPLVAATSYNWFLLL